jgi:predicted GH43/DUF377 family glycosyl hydrolase
MIKKKIKKAVLKKTVKKPVKKIKPKKKAKVLKVVKRKIKVVKPIKKSKKIVLKKKLAPKKKRIIKKLSSKKQSKSKNQSIRLKKPSHNPIIGPSQYSWESKATFNPAAFESNGKIHIVYRAVGEDDNSVLGYAYTYDGLNIDGRPTYHIYRRSFDSNKNFPQIDYISGGGWSGGCEDPRITLIGDTVYMIYTAFDGWGSVRLAMTSIKLNDFNNKKWNWKKPVFISPPGEINKNWALFPDKINGKYAIIHSFYPKILIEYFDSLEELDGKRFIKSNNTRPVDDSRTWDSWFRGIGPSPIKTKDGWLILYHAMDHRNPDRYRMGAMLLDLNDPTKILYRSKSPILEPEEDYENNGHKWGVIYSCGAVVRSGELFVYYGGADKFVCVASIKLQELIDDLKSNVDVKLKRKDNKEI